MSGYRAAPHDAVVIVHGETASIKYTRLAAGWYSPWGGVSYQTRACLDALYYARLAALDSAAAACEAIGDARGAEAVRRLKEQE